MLRGTVMTYMNFTREQAIELHRKMWNWIADETEKQKRKVYKDEYFYKIGIENAPKNMCHCCEFNNKNPINCLIKSSICSYKYPYYAYWITCNSKNWKEAARLARIMANLPEREVQH